jgi:hypothetical protein
LRGSWRLDPAAPQTVWAMTTRPGTGEATSLG